MHYGQLRRRRKADESAEGASATPAALSLEQRLVEIKKRHEIFKQEIASIHRALESETDPVVGVEDEEEDPEAEGAD
jgi:hypothetical protein